MGAGGAVEVEEVGQATGPGRALAAEWSGLLRRAQALGPQERFRVASVGYRRCRLAAGLQTIRMQHPQGTLLHSSAGPLHGQVVTRHLALAKCSEVNCLRCQRRMLRASYFVVEGCASARLCRSLQVGDKPEDAVPVVWLLLHPSKHCAPELSGSHSFGAPIQVRSLGTPHPQSFPARPC